MLFAEATAPGELPPADTVEATLAVARNPGLDAVAIYSLGIPQAPFQPQLSEVPANWAIHLLITEHTRCLLHGPSVCLYRGRFTCTPDRSQTHEHGSCSGSNFGNAGDGRQPSQLPPVKYLAVHTSAPEIPAWQPSRSYPRLPGVRNASLVTLSSSEAPPSAVSLSGTGTELSYSSSLPTGLIASYTYPSADSPYKDTSGNANDGSPVAGVAEPAWSPGGLIFSKNSPNVYALPDNVRDQGVTYSATICALPGDMAGFGHGGLCISGFRRIDQFQRRRPPLLRDEYGN